MAVTVSDRLLTVGRGRDREGLMPAIAGRDRQGSNPVAGRPGLVPISQPRQHCIRLLGRWSSAAFLTYVRTLGRQLAAATASISKLG